MRLIAAAVDGLFLLTLCGLTQLVVEGIGAVRLAGLVVREPLQPAVAVVALIVSLSEVAFEASPGKLVLGMRIRTDAGSRASVPRRALRWLLKASPAWLLTAVALLDALRANSAPVSRVWIDLIAAAAAVAGVAVVVAFFAAGGRRRQSLYDMCAGTAVYDARHDATAEQRGFEPVLVSAEPRTTNKL